MRGTRKVKVVIDSDNGTRREGESESKKRIHTRPQTDVKSNQKSSKVQEIASLLKLSNIVVSFSLSRFICTNQTLVVQIHHGSSMASELCHASEVIGLGIAEPQLCTGEEKIPWNFGIALCLICWLLETYTR